MKRNMSATIARSLFFFLAFHCFSTVPKTKATIFTKSTHQSKSAVTSIHSLELCKTNFSSKKTKL
jgi:hypothetical protein